MTEDKISIVSARWGAGIIVTMFVLIGSNLWNVHSEAAAQEAEVRVLQEKAASLEAALAGFSTAMVQITSSVSEMKTDQAAFCAEMRSSLKNIDEEIRRLHRLGAPGDYGGSP